MSSQQHVFEAQSCTTTSKRRAWLQIAVIASARAIVHRVDYIVDCDEVQS
jgi:hypothetical protein